MKTTAILFLAYLALCVQCSVPENKSTKKEISTQPIKVGVFDGHGGAQTCIWETVAAIRLDPEMEVHTSISGSSRIAATVSQIQVCAPPCPSNTPTFIG